MVGERPSKLLQNWEMLKMFSFSFKRGWQVNLKIDEWTNSIYEELTNEQTELMNTIGFISELTIDELTNKINWWKSWKDLSWIVYSYPRQKMFNISLACYIFQNLINVTSNLICIR